MQNFRPLSLAATEICTFKVSSICIFMPIKIIAYVFQLGIKTHIPCTYAGMTFARFCSILHALRAVAPPIYNPRPNEGYTKLFRIWFTSYENRFKCSKIMNAGISEVNLYVGYPTVGRTQRLLSLLVYFVLKNSCCSCIALVLALLVVVVVVMQILT